MSRARPSIRQQLQTAYNEAHKRDGLTLVDLSRKSGLGCSESGLYRKLFGGQPLRSDEVEALAKALGVEVVAGKAA
jgi:cyanate lyase